MKAMERKSYPMPQELEREGTKCELLPVASSAVSQNCDETDAGRFWKRYTEVKGGDEMGTKREKCGTEPCVGSDLRIRWYGEQYSAPELERHYEETVYIRDSGKELMVYSMRQTAGMRRRR